MATGTYGTIRPADVSPEDVEIFYHFTPTRDKNDDPTFTKLNAVDVLQKVDNPNKSLSNVTTFEIFGGVYTLKLPVSDFSAKGFV